MTEGIQPTPDTTGSGDTVAPNTDAEPVADPTRIGEALLSGDAGSREARAQIVAESALGELFGETSVDAPEVEAPTVSNPPVGSVPAEAILNPPAAPSVEQSTNVQQQSENTQVAQPNQLPTVEPQPANKSRETTPAPTESVRIKEDVPTEPETPRRPTAPVAARKPMQESSRVASEMAALEDELRRRNRATSKGQPGNHQTHHHIAHYDEHHDDHPTEEHEHDVDSPVFDSEIDVKSAGHKNIPPPTAEHFVENVRASAEERRRKLEKQAEEDAVEVKTTPRVAHVDREDIDLLKKASEKVRLAETIRYRSQIEDPVENRKYVESSSREQGIIAERWAKEHPPFEDVDDIDIPKAAYDAYIATLPITEETIRPLGEFLLLSSEEQAQLIEESEAETVRAALEKAKKRKEAGGKKEKKSFADIPERETVPTPPAPEGKPVPRELLQEFLESLTKREYDAYVESSDTSRATMFNEWRKRGLEEKAQMRRSFVDTLDASSLAYFESLSDRQKLEVVNRYISGDVMKEFTFKGSGGDFFAYDENGDELQPPSYFTYDKYKDDKGEDYYEVIQEYNRRYNTLTPEQKKLMRKRDRLVSYLLGKSYTLVALMFDFEAKLSEENKKNQEMIRGIVDTGPDYNERIVFAQRQSDGSYLDYNGNKVSSQIVQSMQKKALHNPSRFQALCHYELSKREEPEQQRLWNEIFTMMAHHGYDKYSMWGVVVGLQFMNKPSYLAYKNAVIEWAPLYETEMDEHGHPKKDKSGQVIYKTDDEGRPKAQRYTAETIWRTNRLGKKVHVLDPDGKPVQIGDVKRDRYKARFATIELTLNPGDQEYNEIRPDTGNERYAMRTRIVRSKTEKEENGKYKILRTEEYKVKMILKVKEISFAHELAGKFASYQYGFRSADVAITLDVARHSLQTALRCARAGDFTSKEFQIALYVLSRLKQTVDTTRLGGSTGTDGAPGEEDAARQRLMEAQLRQSGASNDEVRRGIEKQPKGYPPRISGTAEANSLWDELAGVVDYGAQVFPNIRTILKSDYQALQDPVEVHHTRRQGRRLRRLNARQVHNKNVKEHSKVDH